MLPIYLISRDLPAHSQVAGVFPTLPIVPGKSIADTGMKVPAKRAVCRANPFAPGPRPRLQVALLRQS